MYQDDADDRMDSGKKYPLRSNPLPNKKKYVDKFSRFSPSGIEIQWTVDMSRVFALSGKQKVQ